MLDLEAPKRGCLLLADISGYTQYIGGTELAHAQDVVADLLETIVDSVEPLFTLAKLEGDAAFTYADGSALNPSMVLDTIESSYFAFQRRLRDIVHSTTCECNACIRIPSLDLKFFVHDGEYVIHRIARSEELTGPDVILVHRLAKGTSGEKIGRPAYAVFTAATLNTMGMDPGVLGFVPHTETFGDIGDVEVFIQDLALRWTFEKERNRDYVTAAMSVFERSFETPAAPAVVWDHLTDPTKRVKWQKNVTAVLAQTEGRRGTGSVNHCMHGDEIIVEHVADWRPFSYITLRYDVGPLANWAWTYQLDQLEAGTRLTMRLSDPGQEVWAQVGGDFSASVDDQATHLEALLLDSLPS